MRSTKHPRSDATSGSPRPSRSGSLIRSEWPFLLYPFLVVAALGVLYIANRPGSQDQSRMGGVRAKDTKSVRSPVLADGITNEQRGRASPTDPNAAAKENAPSPGTHKGQLAISDDGRKLANDTRQSTPPADSSHAPVAVAPTAHEPAIIGTLRRAVQTKDHAALKACLDQLVALGDRAVAPLSEFIARGENAGGAWAAEALARIGTPAATMSMLDTLSQMADGSYKEQIAKKLSSISNHDSWPLLLDAVQTSEDAAVRRAASTSLSRMADAPIVDELVTRYDAAATTDDAAQWAQTVANISSSKATDPLLALAKQVPSAPDDPLDRSILNALANIGDPQGVNYLLTRLEASGPGEGAYLMNIIGQISQPQGQTPLLYAAAGNKEVSAELGRTAAIQALKNYPNEQSYVLLEQIASVERNATVATAASRTLAAIQSASPMLAASAQVRPGVQILLPANSVRK